MALENKEQIYTEKSTLKNWFRSKLKPTQGQFWAWMDSYWHKGEKLPINTIDGLGEAVDGKAPLVHYHEQYATNDATSLSNENVLSWKQKLGVDDLKFDDLAITTTQDYAEFGLAQGATINVFNNAIYSEVLKKLDAPTENTTNEYVLLADGSTAAKSDFGKVAKVMDVNPDANKNVDFSGVAMNWTNASQRFSGLVSKHNDATYNRLLGMDANGYINEVGLPALTNEMSKATDAQKDAWRIASRKTGETYSTGQPRVDAIYPLVYTNTANRNTQINLLGINLYVNNASSYIRARKIKDLDNADNVGEWFNIDNIESFESIQGLLKISYNLFNITTGIYEVEITHNGLTGQTKPIFYIYSSIVNEDLNQPFVVDQDNGQIEKIDDSSNLVKFSSSLSINQTSGVVSKKIITSSDSDHDFQINFSSTALDIRYGAGNSNNSRNSISIVDDVTGSTIWNFSTYRSDVYINNKQYGTNLANTTGTMVINVVVRKNIVVTIIDRYGKDTFVDTKTLTIGNSGSKTLMISTNGVHNNASDVYQHKIESLNILK